MSSSVDSETGSREKSTHSSPELMSDPEKLDVVPQFRQDAFGDEEFAEVKYKVLKWWYVIAWFGNEVKVFN
jgi:hypothetical protein